MPSRGAHPSYRIVKLLCHQCPQKTPSEQIKELTVPDTRFYGRQNRPRIIELLNVTDYTHQTNCEVDIDTPLFEPIPGEIVFHKYEPFKSYEAVLHLRNVDKASRRVKIIPPDSPHFSIRRMPLKFGDESSKVAMGMCVEYRITFEPHSHEDYFYDICVCTEREKFIVPITAVGRRPCLDFPDSIYLGQCAVKVESTRSVLVTNVGEKEGSFDLGTEPPFTVNPRYGRLAAGESLQCTVGCCPLLTGLHESFMRIKYDYGETVFCSLMGSGEELNVNVPSSNVELLPTYVTKTSQRSFKIHNDSDMQVKFSIRKEPTREHELNNTKAMVKRLGIKGDSMCETLSLNGVDLDLEANGEDAFYGDGRIKAVRTQYLEAKQIKLQSQLFKDENFSIYPLEGVIPPNRAAEITVEFRPTYARLYENSAYIDVQGREDRIPVTIRAKGLGPEAVFSYDVLDVGDTFINTLHQYEVELQNRGKIDAQFQLLPPNTEFGSKFRFEPDHGSLVAGQIQIIKVKLLSDILGGFHETFRWEILSSSRPLILEFKGRVVGPSFNTDHTELDFGIVSYGFRYTKDLTLHNTSEIPMRFVWCVDDDSQGAPEFQILPKSGMILPKGKQPINVEFVSQNVQNYSKKLVLDIPGVGSGLLEVPILAECAVPRIDMISDVLDFGECFIRHSYKESFRLINDSKLPAKFEVLQQDAHSRSLATFTAEPASGGIPAQGEQVVEFTLSTSRLGRIQLPVRVRVIGSRNPPLEFAIEARSIGPIINVNIKGAQTSKGKSGEKVTVDFERVEVLQEHSMTLTVANPSLIPAEFKTFIEGKDSVFEIDKRMGVLQPKESTDLQVSTCLDEAKKFKDTLHILITEGADMDITLLAVGVGNTVVCPELNSGEIDFGNQFTGRAFSKEVLLHNLDRRPVNLHWINETAVQIRKEMSKITKTSERKSGAAERVGSPDSESSRNEQVQVYAVAPERATIGPKESALVTISGLSMRCGAVEERIICKAGVGQGAKANRVIFEVNLKAEVAAPLLEFSDRELRFAYFYEKGKAMEKITKDVTIRNTSKLPLNFALRTHSPFFVTPDSAVLNPGDSVLAHATFDPSYRGDYQSAVTKSKIQIGYVDNSKKDGIELIGEIHRPNLKFDLSKVDFGSVLTDTYRRIVMNVVNCSSLDVVYHWTFVQDALGIETGGKANAKSKLMASQMLDILPIKGILKPGELERMEFSYFAYPGQKAATTAICHVEGGPDYEMPLTAESNSIKFTVEPTHLNVGNQLYDRQVEREITIHNQGKVPFDFSVNLKDLSRKDIVESDPEIGRVGPGQKETLKLKIRPGYPDKIDEKVFIELAHFDPIPVTIAAEGVYPLVMLTLPRAKDDSFQQYLDRAQDRLLMLGPKLQPIPKPPKSIISRVSPSQKSPQGASKRRTADYAPSQRPPSASTIRSRALGPASPSRLSQPRIPLYDLGYTKTDWEAEADRLKFQDFLVERALRKAEFSRETTPRSNKSQESTIKSENVEKKGSSNKAPKNVKGSKNQKKKVDKRAMLLVPKIPPLCISHYVIDFGYVIKGTQKVKKFKIQNISTQQVSFQLDKHVLEGYGLTMEPESVLKLPGAPDFEFVDASVTFNTNKSQITAGPLDLVMPIDVKYGPAVLLSIKAHIMTPDVKVSHDTLPFGDVQTGHCKVIVVQLTNPKEVPCEWCIKKPMEAAKAKDWDFYRFVPAEGSLEPGQCTNVKVFFTPVPNRDAPYDQIIPIKVSHSTKTHNIQATGRGYTLRMSFDKSVIDMGPIVPSFDGQEPNEAILKIFNPCDYPIEVLSLNFDPRYASDEQVLRGLKEYDDEDNLYMRPLNPGEPLWSEIVGDSEEDEPDENVGQPDIQEETEKVEDDQRVTNSIDEPDKFESEGDTAGRGEPLSVIVDSSPTVEGEEDTEKQDEHIHGKIHVIVLGAPQTGKSTQSTLMAERYNIEMATFDGLIKEASDIEAPIDVAELDEHLSEVLMPFEESGEALTLADVVVELLLGDEESEPQGLPDGYSDLPLSSKMDLLSRALKASLEDEKYSKGIVIDGVRSRFVDSKVAMDLLISALGFRKRAVSANEEEMSPDASMDDDLDGEVDGPFIWENPGKRKASLYVISLNMTWEEYAAHYASVNKVVKPQEDPPESVTESIVDPEQQKREEEEKEIEAIVRLPSEAGSGISADDRSAIAAEEETVEEIPPHLNVDQSVHDAFDQYNSKLQEITQSLGEAGNGANVAVYRPIHAGSDIESVRRRACGIDFHLGEMKTVLPQVQSDCKLIPDPYRLQIVHRPRSRSRRHPVKRFRILTRPEDPISEDPQRDQDTESDPNEEENSDTTGPSNRSNQTRWILPPKGSQPLIVQFSSDEVGRFQENLAFEVVSQGSPTRPFTATVLVSGTCDYPGINNDYRAIFYRKARVRPRSPAISRQFVISRNRFEFGPLLVGKSREGYEEGAHPEHSAKLRIMNTGLFDLHVEFAFKSEIDKEGEAPTGKPDKGKGDKKAPPPPSNPFFFDTPEMDLVVGETRDLCVYAFPEDVGEFNSVLVCTVDGNPEPVELSLCCVGAKPEVIVQSNDLTQSEDENDKILDEGIVFDRLLLGKTDVKTFKVSNPGLLPIKWTLKGAEDLPKEFAVYPSSGHLEARSSLDICVEFTSTEKKELSQAINLEVVDHQEIQGVAHDLPIRLKGEAYQIEVDFTIPDADGKDVLNFGTVRVCDDASKSLTINNMGKYPVDFRLQVRSTFVKEIFQIIPEEGTIDPAKNTAVQVHFNPDHTLAREITLAADPEISLLISEPTTGLCEQIKPINLQINSVFSKYAITPARGINFGSLQYNTSSDPRTFEISNLGEFPFDFTLTNNRPEDEASAENVKTDDKGKAKGKEKGGNVLQIGPFEVNPATGNLAPGCTAEITVCFQANGSQYFSEAINIDISERDPMDTPGGIVYELAGESCIPGIDAGNIEAIFEEHVISPLLDPFKPRNNEFGRREGAFSFGAVVAGFQAEELPEGRKGQDGVEVRANLKFINPVKIPATVDFGIKPQGEWTPKAGEAYPFDVEPKSLTIPPHEYRYMTVLFAPRAIQSYVATFEANVREGSDPATKGYVCQLRGEGSLPSLTLQVGNFDDDGRPVLKFPRIMKGKEGTLAIPLKNNGILSATGRLDMEHHDAFVVEGGSRTFTVESKKSVVFNVHFKPSEVGEFDHEVQIRVRENPFEFYRVKLQGECFMEDITFEGLPEDSDDRLEIGDMTVCQQKDVVILLKNNSEDHYRFEWPDHPNLVFSPKVGHLHSGATKDICITFQADETIKLDPEDIVLSSTKIIYAGDVSEWDDRLDANESLEKGSGEEDGEAMGTSEPEHEIVEGSGYERVLKVFAVADAVQYECDRKPINFRPTMMFQSRSFAFPLTNLGISKMDFRWFIQNMDGTVDESGIYTVSPEGGVVNGGETIEVVVKFSPVEVEDCRRILVCHIPNLLEDGEALTRGLNGRVLRPWCHFDLPSADYLSAGRRSPEMPGPGGDLTPPDANTKVLEFTSLGVKVKNTKRFHVLNPTNVAYEFVWELVKVPGASPGKASPFSCLTKRGVMSSGRRYEMAFDFTPASNEIHESFWVFKIPEHGLEAPFLLVGQVSEPHVSFDRPAINFGKVLVGAKSRVSFWLVNDEHLPFTFRLDKSTYQGSDDVIRSTGKKPVVDFQPSIGTVPPYSRLELVACFRPDEEDFTNYNVVCYVNKKPQPLTLNVKGEGYAIHSSMQMDGPEGSIVELSHAAPNNISFGEVIINERSVKSLALVNSGDINYDFCWDVGTNPRVTVRPEAGTVTQGERFVCELCYNPHVPEKLENYRVTCSVVNGHRYAMNLTGVGHKPRLDLSFYRHDFGLVFVQQAGMTPARKLIRARNDDVRDISFDVRFENTESLQVDCPPTVLSPGEYKDIPIMFTPCSSTVYEATIPFEINGLYSVNVYIRGEGTPMRIELHKPSHRNLNLGAIGPYNSATKVVKLVNRSRVAANISLIPSLERLRNFGIDMLPATDMFLRARESGDITLFFRPPGRLPPFSEDLEVDVAGVRMAILTLSGACLGTEVRLASNNVPFGAVTMGSRASKKLQIENTGDIGTKFVWDTSILGDKFTIFPTECFLPAGKDVKLDVTFHPQAVHPDIRVEKMRCRIEGGEDLFLTLTGACIESQAQPEVIEFSCGVRRSTTKGISLQNSTTLPWQLRPVIQNDYWSGPEFLNVPAGAKADYQLTYSPLTMSSDGQPHTGSVFFPIPDGTGLLYNLAGVSDQPIAEGSIEKTVPAKTVHKELLRVDNWLQRPQRFHVVIDRIECDESTRTQGTEYIDVPPLSNKSYKLEFYSYTESVTVAKVTFKNETTGEFIYYDVKFSASKPPVQKEVHLECSVRTQCTQSITIQNPLSREVSMSGTCTNSQVSFPSAVVLKPSSPTTIPIFYRPLLLGEDTATLTLDSPELGSYEYDLKLKGVPTGPERSLTFTVPLGSQETQVFRFTHWSPEKCEYKCAFKAAGVSTTSECPFTCPSSITADPAPPEGREIEFEVVFEPTIVGESSRDTLVVSSSAGGEYECPVAGNCVQPKPQGPLDLTKGSAGVQFKNVFNVDVEFFFAVDNAAFSVKGAEKIAAKKVTSVPISFKDDGSGRRTGRLTVTCPGKSDAQWVYYLQA